MYNKKYLLEDVEEFNNHNPIYDDMDGSICYLAYLNIGERGWFLYEDNCLYCHRIHTSIINNVEYTDDKVIVTTKNTKLTFKLIN